MKDLGIALLTLTWLLAAIAFAVGVIANLVWGEFDTTLFYIGVGGGVICIPLSIYLWSNERARTWILFWLLPF